MLDFIQVQAVSAKRDVVEIYPEFLARKSKDLMIKGNRFYAIWDEESGFWTTSEYDAQRIIDNEILKFSQSYQTEDKKVVKLLKNFSSRKFQEWQQYCHALPDNYQELDGRIIFSNTKLKKTDYATKELNYAMEPGDISAYDELIGTLYSKEEREKLEWAIGAIISGDSKKIQKFIVLFGAPGSGKSTFLKIIEALFPGYYDYFDSSALTKNSDFALESLKSNPLIAIEHDGRLSRIEDNTKLNSIVSHESLVVNEKFKNTYASKFRSFIFMGSNEPVKITDTKSGIIRRLIDVIPSGNKIPIKHYNVLMEKKDFELGAIAYHCLEVYKRLGANYYDNYIPTRMMEATNNFYNFINDEYAFFAMENPDGIDLNTIWRRYKIYCEDANIQHPYEKRQFKIELANFFDSVDGKIYKGFKKDKFHVIKMKDEPNKSWIDLKECKSIFDNVFSSCKAQYANDEEKPIKKWNNILTELKDIDTTKLHYVIPPSYLIVIDFDLKDQNGNKSLELNLMEASKWPKTYVEVSKGGNGLHLHYIYDGDVSKLEKYYNNNKNIEIKVFTGKASLRRKLSLCNDQNISTINSGLPIKEEEKPMLNANMIANELTLRRFILRNLKKEIHAHTKPSMDLINKALEDSYNQGMHYDVTDLIPDLQQFANNATNSAPYCLKLLSKMKLKSDDASKDEEFKKDGPIVFFDCEVFPNLFVVCWKKESSKTVNSYVNPTPNQIRDLFDMKLVGFNNRKYDNHILYARVMGYNNKQLYELSQNIVTNGVLSYGFNEAYNISYTDIYDLASNDNKISLKKWEVRLGIHHLELGIPWDQNVDEPLWDKVVEYCCNDVMATEAVWNSEDIKSDFRAREILADISGLTVNNTTNQCTIQIIVGNDKHPQDLYVYTDLSKIFPGYEFSPYGIDRSKYNKGTKIVKGKSLYLGEDPGEGGYVYANPGMYYNVGLFDIASMHPTSAHELNIFGPYTDRFWQLVQVRLYIKHEEYDKAKELFNGKLVKYLDNDQNAKELSKALKTAINSVYGLTSSTFPNKLRDPKNVDNIVAKRGALFMINLKHEVENKGYVVVHIKTDSIKIANCDEDIKNFVMEYGKKYGYTFEHEATYERICLVNESTYIAWDGSKWTATGDQYKVPYVFKSLCSHEEIGFDDLCEVDSVTSSLYLDMNENLPEGEHDYRFIGRVGQFVPILPGYGGGILLRDAGDGKYSAVAGTKKKDGVYRWFESEMVKNLKMEDKIDLSYWEELKNKAIENLNKFGDAEKFLNTSFDQNGVWKGDDFINPPEGPELLPFN